MSSKAKEAALQQLMDLLDKGHVEDLKGLKKPVAAMSITEMKPDDDAEPDGDEGDEGDDESDDVGELSPIERALIAKHRKGM